MNSVYTTNSPEETFSLGARIGSLLKGGDTVLLHGELGTGKTLLTKGIVSGMGPVHESPVVSPSFTLVNIYKARLDIIHVDLYRLDSEEIKNLGLEDFMDMDHVIIVEWAERAGGFFTDKTLEITIAHQGEHSRRISITSELPWIEAL